MTAEASSFNFVEEIVRRTLHAARADRTALFHEDAAWTYRQIFDLAARFERFLRAAGAPPRVRVALLLDDVPELVAYFLGSIRADMTPVLINTRYRSEQVLHILRDCRPGFLVTTTALRRGLGDLGRAPVARVIQIDDAGRVTAVESSAAAKMADTSDAGSGAFWLYTSGSSGTPKGVIHGHRSVAACAEAYGTQVLALRETDVLYSTARIPFAYGLGNSVYLPMWVGAASVLSRARNVFDIVDDIRRYRPSVLFAIPTVYAQLLALRDITRSDLSSIRLCVSAAERLPIALWQAFADRFGLEICEGLGTTEFLHICVSNRPGAAVPGSVGTPVPGYQVRLLRRDGTPADPGEPGRLEVGGPSLMLGYWNRNQLTRPAPDSVESMQTGDVCTMDGDRRLTYIARADDLFKVRGQWISPVEIEEVIRTCPGVAECAVLPAADGDQLAAIEAYVRPESAAPTSMLADDIRQHVRARLPGFKVPRHVHLVAGLPRTATGKIDRTSLRTWACGG